MKYILKNPYSAILTDIKTDIFTALGRDNLNLSNKEQYIEVIELNGTNISTEDNNTILALTDIIEGNL